VVAIAIIVTPRLYRSWAFSHQRLPVGSWVGATKNRPAIDGFPAASFFTTLQFSNDMVTTTYVQGTNVYKKSARAYFVGWNRVMLRSGGDPNGEGPFTYIVSASGDMLTVSMPTCLDEQYKKVQE
jgi:hypothetical protein